MATDGHLPLRTAYLALIGKRGDDRDKFVRIDRFGNVNLETGQKHATSTSLFRTIMSGVDLLASAGVEMVGPPSQGSFR